MTRRVEVKNLKSGDNLGTCVVISSEYAGTYHGKGNQQRVRVRWRISGQESLQYWNRKTLVSIND